MSLSLPLVILLSLIFLISCALFKSIYILLAGIVLVVFLVLYHRHAAKISSYVRFEDPKVNQLKERLSQAIPEIRGVKMYGSNASFTIDKKASYICVKNGKGEYYSDNMLTYVILHELAHVLSPKLHHDPPYEDIFKSLLYRAEKAGLYDSNIPLEDEYCGYH